MSESPLTHSNASPASSLRRIVSEQVEALTRAFGGGRVPREPDEFFRSRMARSGRPVRFFVATYVVSNPADSAYHVVHTVTFVEKVHRAWVPLRGYVRHRPKQAVLREAYAQLDKLGAAEMEAAA